MWPYALRAILDEGLLEAAQFDKSVARGRCEAASSGSEIITTSVARFICRVTEERFY